MKTALAFLVALIALILAIWFVGRRVWTGFIAILQARENYNRRRRLY